MNYIVQGTSQLKKKKLGVGGSMERHSQFQFGNFKNRGVGSQILQNVRIIKPNFKLSHFFPFFNYDGSPRIMFPCIRSKNFCIVYLNLYIPVKIHLAL